MITIVPRNICPSAGHLNSETAGLGLFYHCHVALHTSCVPAWEPAPERPGLVFPITSMAMQQIKNHFIVSLKPLIQKTSAFEKGICAVLRIASLGLLSDSTTLNLELWSLSGPAAASGPVPVVARATRPRALNFPQLSG